MMPSTRRVKVLFITLALIVFSLLYLSSSARSSNREFYDRTVAGLENKAAKAAEAAHVAPQKGKAATDEVKRPVKEHTGTEEVQRPIKAPSDDDSKVDEAGKKARVKSEEQEEKERKPPQVVLGEGDRKGVSGGGKWDTGEEEEKKEDKVTEEDRAVDAALNDILKKGPIIIFSKSYCPYSKKAKHIFSQYTFTPSPYIVELDELDLGAKLQAALEKLTGRRTVPNILVSGTSIGGGDDVAALHEEGTLVAKVNQLGGKRIVEAHLKDSKLRGRIEKL